MMKTKITELVRTARLRQPLVPSVTFDAEVSRFTLIVTLDRGFWALFYQLRGLNPATGKRWGGGIRHELGDAMLIPVAEARAAGAGGQGARPSKGGAHTMKPWPHAPPKRLLARSYHQQSMKLSTLTLQRL